MEIPRPYFLLCQGLVWLAVGLYLLPLGIFFLMQTLEPGYSSSLPLYGLLASISLTPTESACSLLALGLLIGRIKSRTVFAKAVTKSEQYVASLPARASVFKIYPPRYILLVGVMMGLGISMRVFSVPLDIRGFVDVAVGAALTQGAIAYFKAFRKALLLAA
jgi:hypothetical protein